MEKPLRVEDILRPLEVEEIEAVDPTRMKQAILLIEGKPAIV